MLQTIKQASAVYLTPFAFAADEKMWGKDGQNNQTDGGKKDQKEQGQQNQNGNDKKPAM